MVERSLPASRAFAKMPVIVLGVILALLCLHQTRTFGPMFDYGLVIQGTHLMNSGLLPHRDFPCSLQILTFFIAHAAQTLFGVRYLSLGLANVFVGLLFFVTLYALLFRRLGKWTALIIPFSLTLATAGQHGIIWYNTVGAALFLLLVTAAERMAHDSRRRWVLVFFILGTLSGISKLNFHITAMAASAVLLLYAAVKNSDWRRRGWWIGLLAVTAVSGPALEMLICGLTPGQWMSQVVTSAGGRILDIFMLLSTPRGVYTFFFGIVRDFYPARFARALPALYLLVYGLAWHSLKQRHGGLLLFLACLALSAIPNILPSNEIIILRASFLMSGLVILALLENENRRLQKIVGWASVYLAVISTFSIFHHSRLAFEPITGPFTEGGNLHPYFAGVRVDYRRTQEITAVKKVLDSGYGSGGLVYFGPGTNYFYGPFGGVATRGLPIWWDTGSSYKEADLPALAEQFGAMHFDLITFNEWGFSLPKAIHDKFGDGYRLVDNAAEKLNILVLKNKRSEIT